VPSDDCAVDIHHDQEFCVAEIASVEHALTRLVRLAEARRMPAGADRLDRAAYAVLARIEELPATRLTELAAVMDIDLSTASRQVRGLETRGYVTRLGDPDDQRAARLELTVAGRDALSSARTLRLERIASRLSNWEHSDIADLARLLGQLVASFSQPSPNAEVDGASHLASVGGLSQ
jgi:DNA-binding MarR family transcriptional regulator